MRSNSGKCSSWLAAFAVPLVWFTFGGNVEGGYITIVNNGPDTNRVNIVFMGDGYTAGEQDTTYNEHINAMVTHLFSAGEDPYPRYHKYFNIHRVNLASAESGASAPPEGISRNTALGASYYFNGAGKYSLFVDIQKARAQLIEALKEAPFKPQVVLIPVNAGDAGGCSSGQFSVFAGGYYNGSEIALHEMGHSFNGLADQYGGIHDTYIGKEPREVNVTASASGEKWSQWLGYDQPGVGKIGVYEGGYYYDRGVYGPSANSKMRYLGQPFDVVSREKIVLDIYNAVRPVDSWASNDQPVVDPELLWVKVVDPEVVKVSWLINDQVLPDTVGQTLRLSDIGFNSGTYTITAKVSDTTEWVRRNRESLEQSVKWTVELTAPVLKVNTAPAAVAVSSKDDLSAKAVDELKAASLTITGLDSTPALGTSCGVPAIIPMGLLALGFSTISGRGGFRPGRSPRS